MSRYIENEYEGEGQPPQFWQHNFDRHVCGPKGRAILAEFEEALLVLPEKRLIVGRLACVPDPEFTEQRTGVCAVGAYIVHKRVKAGEDRAAVIADLAAQSIDGDDDPYEASAQTVDLGKAAGLSELLAWTLHQLNDELEMATPEEVYERVLAYVRRLIAKGAPAVAQ